MDSTYSSTTTTTTTTTTTHYSTTTPTTTVQVGMLFVGLAIVLYGHVAKTPQQSYRTCTGFLCPTSGR